MYYSLKDAAASLTGKSLGGLSEVVDKAANP